MADNEVRIENLTRREFREALERGEYRTAIVPTGAIEQHLEHLPMGHDFGSSHPGSNVQFQSYWNLSREDAEAVCEARVPGHAGEYETSTHYAMFPGNIREDAMRDQEDKQPLDASAEKGEKLVEAAIARTVTYLEEMMAGEHHDVARHVFSAESAPKA